jgi:hypothetical protein
MARLSAEQKTPGPVKRFRNGDQMSMTLKLIATDDVWAVVKTSVLVARNSPARMIGTCEVHCRQISQIRNAAVTNKIPLAAIQTASAALHGRWAKATAKTTKKADREPRKGRHLGRTSSRRRHRLLHLPLAMLSSHRDQHSSIRHHCRRF